ncbi:MAG: HD domain-containing phosphohydrolase [Planctomycetota bacterium]
MLRVDATKLRPGMTLALPVMHPQTPTQTLLRTGYTLNDAAVQRLRDLKVRVAWVRAPGMQALEKHINPEVMAAQSQVFAQIAGAFETAQLSTTPKLPIDAYTDAVTDLVKRCLEHPAAALFVGDLHDAGDDQLRHASGVAYLSLLMGLKLEGYLVQSRRHVRPDRAKDVKNLGVGAMLHDLGVTRLDADARDAYLQHGDDEHEGWRQHPALGYAMVRGQVEPTAANVVLHHHQRADGSGYTGGEHATLSGESIHIYARIAGVADQFDRLRRPPGLPEQPVAFALHAMMMPAMRKRFDETVLQALLRVVPPFAPGSRLLLSDGSVALAVQPHDDAPCRPTIQVLESFDVLDDPDAELDGPLIDLREEPATRYVRRCDQHEVGAYLFELPKDEDAIRAA